MSQDEEEMICTLCVLAVSRASAYVSLQPLYDMDLNEWVPGIHQNLVKGQPNNVCNAFAGRPANLIRFARTVPRSWVKGFWIDETPQMSWSGIWADVAFFGTPVCVNHLPWAEKLWKERK